jgi:outer membrane protein OmpA-like peptidoglycan-associated protein/tetratricopeptide (TPR) repeat protein
MKTRPAILFLLAILLFTRNSFAQTDKQIRDQANFYYRHFSYSEAIPLYKSIGEKISYDNVQLAECYRLTNQPTYAAIYFGKSVADTAELPLSTELHYGQVLMMLEKYSDAEKQLKAYLKKAPSDRRAQHLTTSCQTALKRKTAKPGGIATFLTDMNTDYNEFAPTVWNNKIVFTSDSAYEQKKKNDSWTGSNFFNIYTATFDSGRTIYGGEISIVARTQKGNFKFHDGPCTFASDINEMYFTRTSSNSWTNNAKKNKDSIALLTIMVASQYDSAKGVFMKVIPFDYNSKTYSVAHPAISPDGRILIFAADKKGGAGGFDLYMCKRQADGKWLTPENMGYLLNTEGDELFPYLADDKTLFFSSDGQKDCFGGLDVYKSQFNGTNWSAPENTGIPVNSSYDDISLAMRNDGKSSFFSSNRPAKTGGDNIYLYQNKQLILFIDVRDAVTQKPVPDACIMVTASIDSFTGKTDEMGEYTNRLYPKFPYSYKVTVAHDRYTTRADSSVFYGSGGMRDTIYIPVDLNRAEKTPRQIFVAHTATDSSKNTQTTDGNGTGGDQKIFFNLKITDCRTRKPVKDTGVKVNVTFDTTIKRISYYLHTEVEDGELVKELYPGKKYMLEVSSFDYKALYITKINTDFINNLRADTVIFDSVCLDAREDIIDLGLIPFDFDSANLNDLAQTRLIKFVRYLNEFHPTIKLLIRGHTDCRELKPGHNKILSDRRAKAVMNYLIQKGVAAKRLRAVGVGAEMPRIRCNNCEHDNSTEKIINKQFIGGRTDCGVNEHAENRYIDCVILSY